MEEITTADQIRPGDIIKCICTEGCTKPDTCQQFCKLNACTNQYPQSWQRVLHIAVQPALNQPWLYFSLTNNKEFGVWAKNAVIRYVP